MEEDEVQALGWVPVEGRGALPFSLVHGESLVASASWAVGEAGVQLYDASVGLEQLRSAGRPLLLHDPLCPLAPAHFLAEAVALCVESGQVVVGFRPVTDTIKESAGATLGRTVDRSLLRSVATPVVIPAAVLAGMEELDSTDFPRLVAVLAERSEVAWIEAPALARRLVSVDDLGALEALSRAGADGAR